MTCQQQGRRHALLACWLAGMLSIAAMPAAGQEVASEPAPAAFVQRAEAPAPAAPATGAQAPGLPSSAASRGRAAAGHPVAVTPATAPAVRSAPAPQDARVDIRMPHDSGAVPDMALAVRIVLGLTLLAVLPALLVCMTAFLRIIVVLSMLRFAIGMAETPPNAVLIGLAMFLTIFTMQPVLQSLNHDALQPLMQGKLVSDAAYAKAAKPLREFMVRQTREQDLALVIELAKAPQPGSIDDVGHLQLVPAFMLSELRAAFQIGFVIFLPFLLIDLIVSSILMALGMMMMPPVTVALPIKVLMFILVDGWSLVLTALVGSFR